MRTDEHSTPDPPYHALAAWFLLDLGLRQPPGALIYERGKISQLFTLFTAERKMPRSHPGAITFSGTFSGTLVGARSGAGAGVGAGV